MSRQQNETSTASSGKTFPEEAVPQNRARKINVGKTTLSLDNFTPLMLEYQHPVSRRLARDQQREC